MSDSVRARTEAGRAFFGNGLFDWQIPKDKQAGWNQWVYDENRYWGEFPRGPFNTNELWQQYPWGIGPFQKYEHNPVLSPRPGAWDCGHYDGGVHNGAIVRHEGRFFYVYRGERPIDITQNGPIDYICDIGLAVSDDGIHFDRIDECSPFFRKGERHKYSYEDVNLVRHSDTYYLFCNQWLWDNQQDTSQNGVFLATSSDLRTWEPHGIVFPKASRIHRNGVVVQTPTNDAIKLAGKFVMYINDGLMGVSDDLLHWESIELKHRWPGGEGCFALTQHDRSRPDDVVLFTGGHHTGHFYAIGQVLFSIHEPGKPRSFLPRPMLVADPAIPFESGRDANPPHGAVSNFHDCIFFNGLTRYADKWWLYYGGSEVYTCLATANVK